MQQLLVDGAELNTRFGELVADDRRRIVIGA
jgi:hypothetical protein